MLEIRFRDYILHADQATYDSTTGQITATGHVVFDGGPRHEHVVGSHCTYDVSRDTGVFYDATGSLGVQVKNHTMFLTSSTPFFFTGQIIDKLGPDRYRVHHGYITSCQLPKPKWEMNSSTATIELGEEAVMHHATLRLHGIPVFYFPFLEHPVDNLGRQTGFLIPEIGQSNSRGTILGDGFFWAINRSNDVTLGAYLYSARGWAQTMDLRSLGQKYRFEAEYFGVIDNKGYPGTGQNQGGQELKVNGSKDFAHGFRGVVSVDYLSSYLFRLAFGQSFSESINSEVRSSGFLSKNWNGYGLGLFVSRYQDYQSEAPGDSIDIAHIPSLEFSTVERPFSRTSIVYAFDVAGEGVSRHETGFETAPIVGRVDAKPYFAWPGFLKGWTLRPEIGARETYYSQRLVATPGSTIGIAVDDSINRNAVNGSFEVRPPTLSRIFDHKVLGRVVKHTVEPYAKYRYQGGVDNFAEIIRFDGRDILADTNEIEYGVVNRLFAKKSTSNADCYRHPKYSFLEHLNDTPEQAAKAAAAAVTATTPEPGTCDDKSGPARELITWMVAQKYFMNTTFGGALVPGVRNVFDTTVDFTGIAFLTEARRFSPVISRLRLQDANTDFQWALDYDPVLHQVNASTIFAGQRLSPNWYVAGGQTYLHVPGEVTTPTTPGAPTQQDIFNQYRLMLQYGSITKRGFSSAYSVGVDSRLHYIQSTGLQANYNWDCCGVAFEYSRWALGTVRNENFYRFSFSLTNVGTFGNIRRLQRLY